MASGKGVTFLRDATGLVRTWSTIDGFIFSVIANPIGLWAVLVMGSNAFAFPGADPFLGAAIATVALMPQAIVYAMLASSMPRAGGEYIFQSRILHPALAYVSLGFLLISGPWFVVFIWPVIAGTGFSPLLAALAAQTGNQSLLSLASWIQTPLPVLMFSFVCVGWAWLIDAVGMKIYGLAQRILFILSIITTIILMVVMATTSQQTFISGFNSLAAAITGNSNVTYQSIINQATSSGYSPDYSFSWSQSFSEMAPWSGVIAYIGYYTALSGEIKRANVLKNQLTMSLGALIVTGFGSAIFAGLLTQMVGRQFNSAANYLFFNGAFPLPMPPYAGLFLSALPGLGIAVLAFVFFNSWTWMNYLNEIPYNARVSMAMAFDRMLPSKMAEVDERLHIPLFNITLWCAVLAGLCIFYYFVPSSSQLFLLTSLLSSILFICTMLSGAFFPFQRKMKSVYDMGPVAKYKLGGIPIITILGTIAIMVWLFIDYILLTVPALGVAGSNMTLSLGFAVVIAVFWMSLYLIFYYRNKSRGIDPSVIYSQIPPE